MSIVPDYLQFKMPWRRRQPAGPPAQATSAFMRESRDAAGAPTSPRVNPCYETPTRPTFQTTFEDLEFPSISTISLHDFSRLIEGRKIRSGFSNGIPFFKFILSPYPRRGSFISANNQLGTGWTRVTIRIVPAGQRRQR